MSREYRQSFLSNPFLLTATLVAFLGNAALWVLLAFRLQPRAEVVPLHYNIYFGIDLVGPWWYTYILAIAGLLVFIVNLLLTIAIASRERVAAYFLTMGSILVQIVCFLTVYLMLTQI